ncbi:MAG: hypothetical protein EOP04_05355 [Proteobacteria bacterium]|nr:MAG: hypothetical protein EOP04_05355 [Pseudomonadota bacterium]
MIERSVSDGIRNFFISLNFQADKIAEHLRLPEYENLNIQLIQEEEFLGTAGSLAYMPTSKIPFIVLNADILSTVPLDRVVAFHNKNNADFTCVVRPYRSTIPYGVVKLTGDRIEDITEKPSTDHLVNSGIYVLSPCILELVESNEYLDMPVLIKRAIKAGFKVKPFLLHEYWLDIGKPDDYYKANDEYQKIFGMSKDDNGNSTSRADF